MFSVSARSKSDMIASLQKNTHLVDQRLVTNYIHFVLKLSLEVRDLGVSHVDHTVDVDEISLHPSLSRIYVSTRSKRTCGLRRGVEFEFL